MLNLLLTTYNKGFNPSVWSLRIAWLILMGVIILSLLGVQFTPFLPYWGHKLFHFIGAALIFGAIWYQALHDTWLLSTNSRTYTFLVYKLAMWLSFVYYVATIIIVFNGIIMAEQWGGIYNNNWLFLPISFSFIIYLLYHPIMDKEFLLMADEMHKSALHESSDELNAQQIKRHNLSLAIQWIFTIISLFLLIIILYCMFAKPELDWLTPIRVKMQHLLKIF